MPKPTIERHGASFRVTITIPKDVQHAFDKAILRASIRTTDRAVAESFAYRFAADCADKFIRIRDGLPLEDGGQELTEDSARYFAREWVRRWVENDETARILGDCLHAPTEDGAEAAEAALVRLCEENDESLRRALVLGELDPPMIRRATQAAEELGLHIPPGSYVFRVFAISLAEQWRNGLRIVLKRAGGLPAKTPSAEPPPRKSLGAIVDEFLTRQALLKADSSMLGKYRSILPEMVEYIGDKPCNEVRQNDLLSFSDDLCRMPTTWKAQRAKGYSMRELAELPHTARISKATFDRSYVAAVGAFLNYAKSRYGDDGFPQHLSTEAMEYIGDRAEPEERQRALTAPELVRLFEGAEMRVFAADPDKAHQYWLPLVGLYTGARVREVCQLNPQTDIRDEEGVWFFDITEDSEAAEGVTKSTKTASSRRRVVIHSRLLALGFLDYAAAMKAKGARLLFPQWKPKDGDAAGHAAEWFRQFIRDIGLRDETPGAMVTGFHAFRHTMLTRAKHLRIDDRHLITGHADGKVGRAQGGYEREGMPLSDLQALIERVTFDVSPPAPKRP